MVCGQGAQNNRPDWRLAPHVGPNANVSEDWCPAPGAAPWVRQLRVAAGSPAAHLRVRLLELPPTTVAAGVDLRQPPHAAAAWLLVGLGRAVHLARAVVPGLLGKG